MKSIIFWIWRRIVCWVTTEVSEEHIASISGTCLLVGFCWNYFSTLKMEAICSSETSVVTQQTTRRHIPEDDTLQSVYVPNNTSMQFRAAGRGSISEYILFTFLSLSVTWRHNIPTLAYVEASSFVICRNRLITLHWTACNEMSWYSALKYAVHQPVILMLRGGGTSLKACLNPVSRFLWLMINSDGTEWRCRRVEVPLRQTRWISVTPTVTVMMTNIHAYSGAFLTESSGINSCVSALAHASCRLMVQLSANQSRGDTSYITRSCLYIKYMYPQWLARTSRHELFQFLVFTTFSGWLSHYSDC
jgi:hypothetical protein